MTKENNIAESDYSKFHSSLMGFDCFLEGKQVAKSTLYWMHQRSKNISKRLSGVKVVKRA